MTDADQAGVTWRSRVRLVDEVVAVVRDRIYTGHFALGERLRQEQLAEELEISRTPLREALRILEREGLLEVLPRGGVRVVAPDRDTLLAAYDFREVVDGLAARLAAREQSSELATALSSSLDRQTKTIAPWDAGAYTRENVSFHSLIYACTRNEYVISNLPVLRMTAQVFFPIPFIEPERAISAIEQHHEISERICAGDEQGAESSARRHIHTTIDSLLLHLDRDE